MFPAITTRRVAVGATVLAVGGAIAGALRPAPLPVETAEVRVAPLTVTLDAEGRTRVRDRYVLTAPVAGRLARVALAEGALVRPGDVVARLAPAPLDEASAREAHAALAAARAVAAEASARVPAAAQALAQARRDAERTRRLADAGAVAPRAVEEAALAARARADELAALHARRDAARADVARAEAALLRDDPSGRAPAVDVRAPVAGRVLRLAERSERVVAAGAPIAELGDPRGLEVVVDVLSSDAARVRPGMAARLEGWGGERPVPARVRLVEPAAATRVSALGVEEQRVNVVLDVPNAPPALGDGFRVDARIVTWAAPAVLVVPTGALVRAPDGSGWAAYVVEGGRAALRAVRVGELGGAQARVVAGLRAGERVVLFPSDKVAAGARLATR